MKCADSEEIARSACAKVRRFGGWPVTRCLLSGSSSASASGFRAKIRRNNPSIVGDALFWITGSLWSRVRLLPPGFREITRQGSGRRSFYHIPAPDPLLSNVKQGDSVEARHQGPVERPHRRDEISVLACLQHCRDQNVDGGVFCAHVVSRSLIVRGLASPIERLLVARRQRLIPAVLVKVKFDNEAAAVAYTSVDR